jgi:hypothetical protein
MGLDDVLMDMLDLCAKEPNDWLAYQVIDERIKVSTTLRSHYADYYNKRKEDYASGKESKDKESGI